MEHQQRARDSHERKVLQLVRSTQLYKDDVPVGGAKGNPVCTVRIDLPRDSPPPCKSTESEVWDPKAQGELHCKLTQSLPAPMVLRLKAVPSHVVPRVLFTQPEDQPLLLPLQEELLSPPSTAAATYQTESTTEPAATSSATSAVAAGSARRGRASARSTWVPDDAGAARHGTVPSETSSSRVSPCGEIPIVADSAYREGDDRACVSPGRSTQPQSAQDARFPEEGGAGTWEGASHDAAMPGDVYIAGRNDAGMTKRRAASGRIPSSRARGRLPSGANALLLSRLNYKEKRVKSPQPASVELPLDPRLNVAAPLKRLADTYVHLGSVEDQLRARHPPQTPSGYLRALTPVETARPASISESERQRNAELAKKKTLAIEQALHGRRLQDLEPQPELVKEESVHWTSSTNLGVTVSGGRSVGARVYPRERRSEPSMFGAKSHKPVRELLKQLQASSSGATRRTLQLAPLSPTSHSTHHTPNSHWAVAKHVKQAARRVLLLERIVTLNTPRFLGTRALASQPLKPLLGASPGDAGRGLSKDKGTLDQNSRLVSARKLAGHGLGDKIKWKTPNSENQEIINNAVPSFHSSDGFVSGIMDNDQVMHF